MSARKAQSPPQDQMNQDVPPGVDEQMQPTQSPEIYVDSVTGVTGSIEEILEAREMKKLQDEEDAQNAKATAPQATQSLKGAAPLPDAPPIPKNVKVTWPDGADRVAKYRNTIGALAVERGATEARVDSFVEREGSICFVVEINGAFVKHRITE
jgi:hypothetical protein